MTLKATKHVNNQTPDAMSNNEFRGGYSFRQNVVGKPPENCVAGLMLGSDWVWAEEAQPAHLLNCLTKHGYAVTPGRWVDGHKSKRNGLMTEANYLLLDYDANLSWEQAKEFGYFKRHALFAYTSANHQKPGKGDRFRIVFALDRVVRDANTYDMLINGVRTFCPDGDDVSINAASLLYGNPTAEVHVYDLDNRVNVEAAYMEAAIVEAQRKFSREVALRTASQATYTTDNSVNRVRRWLTPIPNESRSTWVRVAGCMRNIEAQDHDWAYPLFEEWSARNYADFDPYDCERLWTSLEPGLGGFGSLKNLAKYFEQYPTHKEVDQQKYSSQLNNETFNSYSHNVRHNY